DGGELTGVELLPVEEANGTGQQQEVALLDDPIEEGLPRPSTLDVRPGVVLHHGVEDPQAAPRGKHALGSDAPDDRRIHSGLKRADPRQRRGVLVAARRMVEEVAGSPEAESLEQLRAPGTDSLHVLDVPVERVEAPHQVRTASKRRRPRQRRVTVSSRRSATARRFGTEALL